MGMQSVPAFLLQLVMRATIEEGDSEVGFGKAMKEGGFNSVVTRIKNVKRDIFMPKKGENPSVINCWNTIHMKEA